MLYIALGEYRGPRRADTFMSYVVSRYSYLSEASAFWYYLSEEIRMHPQGKSFGSSFADLIDRMSAPDVGANEIIDGVITRAGLEVLDEPS